MRRTKIVCTIGPSSQSKSNLEDLIDAGMNIARQNFSHGTQQQHGELIDRIRSVSENVGVMMDTQGPEIRLKEVENNTRLKRGKEVKIITSNETGNSDRLPVDHSGMLDCLEEGDTILIDDGKIELKVTSIETDQAKCKVVYGGQVSSKKSVNVPARDMEIKAPTEKDKRDIKFGAKKGFDYVSVSFVKRSEEVEEIRRLVRNENSEMDVIAKIEHKKGVENIDDILEVADGIMIARGDLGVEIPPSEVPLLQKRIIEKCNKKGKPVITATQMLTSMTNSPRATRAEVSDVANAVMDGTDAVMLSEETAIGNYPI